MVLISFAPIPHTMLQKLSSIQNKLMIHFFMLRVYFLNKSYISQHSNPCNHFYIIISLYPSYTLNARYKSIKFLFSLILNWRYKSFVNLETITWNRFLVKYQKLFENIQKYYLASVVIVRIFTLIILA
ncbi:hypothetical protein APHACPA_0051 [Rickettsia amblyommatis str. Ac/Pa]|uniref:Uncharacterized protein n=1 Tax=Rickettsia amblyommatis str. Ac/Pa TaxID=1359164 RepID=A0A0F3N052_RICAM|nr:hypothetical protein APHACPA_0051 [Rickettsia amblyommatis str. Ac/Pa]